MIPLKGIKGHKGEQSGEEIQEELQYRHKRLEKIQKAKEALEIREHEINPGKEIDGKKQISFADKEARIMGKKGSFQYAYNVQISVESSNQIIVGEHVSLEANDKKEVVSALEEIEHNLSQMPEKMSMDNGYLSADNIKSVESKEIDAYIATGRERKTPEETEDCAKHKFAKEDFVYEEVSDSYTCPGGKNLELKSSGSDGSKIYQAQMLDCPSKHGINQQCPLLRRCTTSKNGRSVSVDAGEPARRRMRDKMLKPESKEVYRKRKTIVEPVFGVPIRA